MSLVKKLNCSGTFTNLSLKGYDSKVTRPMEEMQCTEPDSQMSRQDY